jgi:hypothetical protein
MISMASPAGRIFAGGSTGFMGIMLKHILASVKYLRLALEDLGTCGFQYSFGGNAPGSVAFPCKTSTNRYPFCCSGLITRSVSSCGTLP